MDEKEKERLMLERAKGFFDNEYEETSLRDEITDIVENTIGKCTASEEIINNLITKLEYHYGEIE